MSHTMDEDRSISALEKFCQIKSTFMETQNWTIFRSPCLLPGNTAIEYPWYITTRYVLYYSQCRLTQDRTTGVFYDHTMNGLFHTQSFVRKTILGVSIKTPHQIEMRLMLHINDSRFVEWLPTALSSVNFTPGTRWMTKSDILCISLW